MLKTVRTISPVFTLKTASCEGAQGNVIEMVIFERGQHCGSNPGHERIEAMSKEMRHEFCGIKEAQKDN